MSTLPPDILDTHLGSRKAPEGPDLWRALNGDLTLEGAMRRAAELRKRINAHEKATVHLFEAILESEEETAQAGSSVSHPLSLLAGPFSDWLRAQGKAERPEPGEAPLPTVHGDNS